MQKENLCQSERTYDNILSHPQQKTLTKMTSVLPVRLGYKQKTPRMWGFCLKPILMVKLFIQNIVTVSY